MGNWIAMVDVLDPPAKPEKNPISNSGQEKIEKFIVAGRNWLKYRQIDAKSNL